MAIIKIEEPLHEYMDNSLTEEQCAHLLENLHAALNSDHDTNQAVLEFAPEMVMAGSSNVSVSIAMLKKYIMNKYSMLIQKMLDQSKELNDLYAKVEDMLKHDKLARFKHRNDAISCEIKDIVLVDTKNPTKKYRITISQLYYNPEYFIKEITNIMQYVDSHPSTRKDDLANMHKDLCDMIDKYFENNFWYTERCEPIMKTEVYNNVKLGQVLKAYESSFNMLYNNIGVFNRVIKAEMQHIQLIEQAYHRMIATYGKDRDGKALVDDVFKKLLKQTATSVEFNDKVSKMLEEMLKFYVADMECIYNLIRS